MGESTLYFFVVNPFNYLVAVGFQLWYRFLSLFLMVMQNLKLPLIAENLRKAKAQQRGVEDDLVKALAGISCASNFTGSFFHPRFCINFLYVLV